MWIDIDKTDTVNIARFADIMRKMGNWHTSPAVTPAVVRRVQKFMRKTNPTALRYYNDGTIEMFMMWKWADAISMWNLYAWGSNSANHRKVAKVFTDELERFLKSKGADRCYASVPTFTDTDAIASWDEFDKLMDVERKPEGKSTYWLMRLDKLKPTAVIR